MNTKKCTRCLRELQSSAYFFHKNRATKDGFHTICKECRGMKFSVTVQKSSPIIALKEEGHMECNQCMRLLPLSKEYYFERKSSLFGFNPKCKECMGREFGIHSKTPTYRIVDKITYKSCTRCDKFLQATKQYFKCYKNGSLLPWCIDCDRARAKKYRSTDGFKVINRQKEQRRRARKKDLSSTLTIDEWSKAVDHWRNDQGEFLCAYCWKVISLPTQEHIVPVSKGGSYESWNIIPVGGVKDCACNQKKNKKTLNEFFLYSEEFLDEHYLKIKNYITSFFDEGYSIRYAFIDL